MSVCIDVSVNVFWGMYVCQNVLICVCLKVCLYFWFSLSVCLSVCLYVYQGVLVSGCLDIPLDVLMSGSVDVRMSPHLSGCLWISGCLDICNFYGYLSFCLDV